MRRLVLSAVLLALLAPFAQAETRDLTLTVAAGKHDRKNEPVCVPLSLPRELLTFKTVLLKQRRLELLMQADASNCTALANVFVTLADNKIALVNIRSVGQQTEQAYLDLVETEESRGFTRLYAQEAA